VTQARCVQSHGVIPDPTCADSLQVTIWGGSAGGGSVTAQMILNGGEEDPPFRAAIPGKVFLFTVYQEKLTNVFPVQQNILGGNHTRTKVP